MRHKFQRISAGKKIFDPAVWHVFLAQNGLFKIMRCEKTVYGSTKRFLNMKCTGNLPQGEMVLEGI